MPKIFRVTLPCIHCGEQNRFVINPVNRFDLKSETVTCWNSEEQKGCRKEMILNQQINLWTALTPSQLLDKGKEAIPAKLADRMGGV